MNHLAPQVRGAAHRPQPTDISISERLSSGGFLSVDEFAGWLGISRGLVYKEKKAGRLKLTRIGKRSLIPAAVALAYRDSLEAA